MNKIMPLSWPQRACGLALSLIFAGAASADGWLYQYQADEATAIDSETRVRFKPEAISALSSGLVVAGTRVQDGMFTGGRVIVRYDQDAQIQSVVPAQQSSMLFSGPNDVLLSLDQLGASAQDKDGKPLYHWRFEFPVLGTGPATTQAQLDASGNALVLRGGRAYLFSRLGAFDLGPASAIASDATSLYLARKSTENTQIVEIAQDGSNVREFAVESGSEVLAFALDAANLLVLQANSSQVAVQRYSRNDFSPGSRRTVALSTPVAELTALSQRFSSSVGSDLSWRVLLSGEGTPQLLISDQLGARFISLPFNVPCSAACRWQSTDSGLSIYSAERLGAVAPKRQTVLLDANGSALDFSNDVVDSIHAVVPFAGGRALASEGKLLAISSEYVGTELDQSVPASLRSVAMLDDQGNSIAIGLNPDLKLVRHSYINAQGARIWEQAFALPYSGVATAAENAERYCTALALTDRRIDVRCLDKRSGALIEFDTLGTLQGADAAPRRLLSSVSPDGRFALWIERGELGGQRSIEYRELSPTVRILQENLIATGVNHTSADLILAGRLDNSNSDLIYQSESGIRLRRNSNGRDFGTGNFAQFFADGGIALGLDTPNRVQRLNPDLSPQFIFVGSSTKQAIRLGELEIYRADDRLMAVDRQSGAPRWELTGDFVNTQLVSAGERFLLLRSQSKLVRVEQRSASTGLILAERVFPCAQPCKINAALWRPEQLRLQLDQHSDLGTRMSINGVEAPNAVPALSLSHPSLIGTWANPALAGQNLVINRISNSKVLFAGWNTQSSEPLQASGAQSQRWYVLLGEIAPLDAAELTIPIYQSRGGRFQSATPTPETKAVGRAFLRLSSCDQLSLRYDFDDNTLDGEVLLQRALPATYPCLGIPASAATEADAKVPFNSHSDWEGGWYDPSSPGQGFFLNDTRISASASDLLYGSWQLFDATSNDPTSQHWFTLSADRGDNQLSAEVKIFQSAGGIFGRSPAGAEVQVGSGTISRIDCESLLFQYRFDARVGQFSLKQGQIVLRKLGGCAR